VGCHAGLQCFDYSRIFRAYWNVMLLPEQSTVRVRITVSFDVGNGVGSFDYNTSGYLQINYTVCWFSALYNIENV